jgi:hypothetical protein
VSDAFISTALKSKLPPSPSPYRELLACFCNCAWHGQTDRFTLWGCVTNRVIQSIKDFALQLLCLHNTQTRIPLRHTYFPNHTDIPDSNTSSTNGRVYSVNSYQLHVLFNDKAELQIELRTECLKISREMRLERAPPPPQVQTWSERSAALHLVLELSVSLWIKHVTRVVSCCLGPEISFCYDVIKNT